MFLEEKLELHPPPNTQTKEKMRKLKLQKAGRRISLFRTAGRPRQMRTVIGHPDQKLDVILITILKEEHLPQTRNSKLLRIPSHPHLPKH